MVVALRKFLPAIAIAVLAFGLFGHPGAGAIGFSHVAVANEPAAKTAAQFDHGHVFLLRGLANVWSRGMDSLGEQLTAKGVKWSIHNHANSKKLADEAVANFKKDKSFGPIVIVGHSLGADAALLMAEQIGKQGVPVRLLVTFDGVARQDATKKKTLPKGEGIQPFSKVSANVGEVLNFYISNGWGREMLPGAGFTGKIDNVDLKGVRKVSHLNIEKQADLQARTVDLIVQILGEKSPRSASN